MVSQLVLFLTLISASGNRPVPVYPFGAAEQKVYDAAYLQRTTEALRARLEKLKGSKKEIVATALVVFGGENFRDTTFRGWESIGVKIDRVEEKNLYENGSGGLSFVYQVRVRSAPDQLKSLFHNDKFMWVGTGSEKPSKAICSAIAARLSR